MNGKIFTCLLLTLTVGFMVSVSGSGCKKSGSIHDDTLRYQNALEQGKQAGLKEGYEAGKFEGMQIGHRNGFKDGYAKAVSDMNSRASQSQYTQYPNSSYSASQGNQNSYTANPTKPSNTNASNGSRVQLWDINDDPEIECPACHGTNKSWEAQVTPLEELNLLAPPGAYECKVCNGEPKVKRSVAMRRWTAIVNGKVPY